MAAAKLETAADRYRRIKEARLAETELFDFKSPSGMDWKLRKVKLSQFVKNGVMPMGLAGKLVKAIEGTTAEAAFMGLNVEDKTRMVAFMRTVVQHCAVDPRIVETPTEPNHLSFEDLEDDDFDAIFAWSMPGGDGAETLDTFRSE